MGIYTRFNILTSNTAELVGYKPSIQGLSIKTSGVFARGGCIAKQKIWF